MKTDEIVPIIVAITPIMLALLALLRAHENRRRLDQKDDDPDRDD